MQERQLLDETFDPQRCGSYQLLLQPGRLGFRLAVHDPLRNQFIAFASLPLQEASEGRWHEAIAKLQVAYPWVASSFRNVRIGWRSHLFTLLPQALFIEAEAKRVLQAMGAFYDCDAIYYNRLTADALMLFTVPGDLVNALQPIQPQFSIIHPDASLHLLALSLFRRSAGLVVHVAEGVVTLILAGQGRLLALLSFKTQAETNVLYRMVALLKAHGLTPNTTPCLTVGSPSTTGKSTPLRQQPALSAATVAALIEQYFPRVSGKVAIPGHSFSYLLESVREENPALFATILCE